MTLERWNDARLDDLHHWIETTAKRVDDTGMIVASHELMIGEINRDRTNRREQRWALLLVLLTVIVGQALNVAISTFHSNKIPSITISLSHQGAGTAGAGVTTGGK